MTRLWGSSLVSFGHAGAHISVSDITDDRILRPEQVTAIDYQEVTHRGRGEMHLYLAADTEAMALEIAAHRFCQEAGVWDVTMLLAWGNEQHRQWRARRDAEIAAAKAARQAPKQMGLKL